MFQIKFDSWQVGTRPYGLKETETTIISDYIMFSRYPNFSSPDFAAGPGTTIIKKPKPILDGFAFQVHLLGGYPPPQNYPDNLKQDWEILSSLKADVIEKSGNNYKIYELKQRINVCTLGQLLTYKWLFEEVLGYPKNTQLIAVGDFIIPGLIQPLLSNGIEIHIRANKWMFPGDFSSSAIRSKSIAVSPSYPTGR